MTIAICSPELNGDVLWALPAARELARRAGCQADFWLGPRGRNLPDLLAVQDFVRKVIVDWDFPCPGPGDSHDMEKPKGSPEYEHVHQLGFRQGQECHGSLLDYFCQAVGLPRQGHWIDIPRWCPQDPLPEGDFVCLAAKSQDGGMHVRWGEMWREFVRRCPLPVVEVGLPESPTAVDAGAINRCRPGFLEMAGVISRCKYFVGHISAPLVIADAFPNVVRIAVHDGVNWNLNACTRSAMNHYPVCYDADTLLRYIG